MADYFGLVADIFLILVKSIFSEDE